jgi:hypothetical protein
MFAIQALRKGRVSLSKIDRIHSASKIGDIQLYLGCVIGESKYLENWR